MTYMYLNIKCIYLVPLTETITIDWKHYESMNCSTTKHDNLFLFIFFHDVNLHVGYLPPPFTCSNVRLSKTVPFSTSLATPLSISFFLLLLFNELTYLSWAIIRLW